MFRRLISAGFWLASAFARNETQRNALREVAREISGLSRPRVRSRAPHPSGFRDL